MDGREAKDQLYEAFARTARAAASPKRIELLELMAQGEREAAPTVSAAGISDAATDHDPYSNR